MSQIVLNIIFHKRWHSFIFKNEEKEIKNEAQRATSKYCFLNTI